MSVSRDGGQAAVSSVSSRGTPVLLPAPGVWMPFENGDLLDVVAAEASRLSRMAVATAGDRDAAPS